MEAIHGVWLSPGQRALLDGWHRADPPDDFERTRNARIRRLQGQGNPFVEQYDAAGTAASGLAVAGE